jgi:OmpA-OmpF porin, OOP family
MHSKRMKIIVGLLTMCFVALTAAYAQRDKIKVKGLITGRTGDTIDLKTADGNKVTVILDDDTKIQQPKRHGIRKDKMPAAVLVPGLDVSVDGASQDATHALAKSITFDRDDLQWAERIQASLKLTEQRVASLQQNIDADADETGKRLAELSECDIKDQLDVHFASGSTNISAVDLEALKNLAHEAGERGYVLQVRGFADSSGNPAVNQKLSMERAQNVIAYLILNCDVSVRHIVSPGAMGETGPVASNDTKDGRTKNRRVEIKLLLKKGASRRLRVKEERLPWNPNSHATFFALLLIGTLVLLEIGSCFGIRPRPKESEAERGGLGTSRP